MRMAARGSQSSIVDQMLSATVNLFFSALLLRVTWCCFLNAVCVTRLVSTL